MKYVIGIVGGIACGKSYVSYLLKEKYNATIIDADKVAHACLETWFVRDELKKRWAKRFDIFSIHDDKEFRIAIAKIIFNDKTELKFFEKLMGPLINEHIIYQINFLDGLIVLDMPLLFESKMNKHCDTVWYVYAEEEKRWNNFLSRYQGKPMEEVLNDFRARENRQMDWKEKGKRSNRVIFNNCKTKEDLLEQIEVLLKMENAIE